MTPVEEASQEAHDAIAAAVRQLAHAVLTPLARIDQAAREGYLELHTTTAAITQRFAQEVGRGIYQLQQQHGAVAENIGAYHQPQLAALAAPVDAAAQRLQSQIHAAIRRIGS